jgi:hypothetical protein
MFLRIVSHFHRTTWRYIPEDRTLLNDSRSSGLLEKWPIVQLLKNFPAFYGTLKFVTVFIKALHWSLS